MVKVEYRLIAYKRYGWLFERTRTNDNDDSTDSVWLVPIKTVGLRTGPVQSVQNAAAGLIFTIQRSEHNTPAARSSAFTGCASQNVSPSNWQLLMTYRSIHGTSPSHLQSCFTRVSDMTSRRRLRSSTSHRLEVLPFRLSTVGRRAFPVSGYVLDSLESSAEGRQVCLPLEVTSAPSLATFRTRLKTFLITESYPDIRLIWHFCVYIKFELF